MNNHSCIPYKNQDSLTNLIKLEVLDNTITRTEHTFGVTRVITITGRTFWKYMLTLSMLGNKHTFLSSAAFFKNQLFREILSGIPSVSVWIQLRPDILSSLIWVQNICIGYQQTKIALGTESVATPCENFAPFILNTKINFIEKFFHEYHRCQTV